MRRMVQVPEMHFPNPMPTTNVAPVILERKQAVILLLLLGVLNVLSVAGLIFCILVFAKLTEVATLLYMLIEAMR